MSIKKPITDYFDILNAKSGNLRDYNPGNVPFVSNSNINNGVVMHVVPDNPGNVINEVPCISVSGFCFASVQLQPFIGAGNGGVHIIALIPKRKMNLIELSYYASQINLASWRFSYGRRAIERRLKIIKLIPFNLSAPESRAFLQQLRKWSKSTIETILHLNS